MDYFHCKEINQETSKHDKVRKKVKLMSPLLWINMVKPLFIMQEEEMKTKWAKNGASEWLNV